MESIELVHLKSDIEQKETLLIKNLREYVLINSKFSCGDIIELPYGKLGKIYSMTGHIYISSKSVQINANGFIITDYGVITTEKFNTDQERCKIWKKRTGL